MLDNANLMTQSIQLQIKRVRTLNIAKKEATKMHFKVNLSMCGWWLLVMNKKSGTLTLFKSCRQHLNKDSWINVSMNFLALHQLYNRAQS